MILSASSPDDEALVLGAKYFGFEFVNRVDGKAVLNTWDVTGSPPPATAAAAAAAAATAATAHSSKTPPSTPKSAPNSFSSTAPEVAADAIDPVREAEARSTRSFVPTPTASSFETNAALNFNNTGCEVAAQAFETLHTIEQAGGVREDAVDLESKDPITYNLRATQSFCDTPCDNATPKAVEIPCLKLSDGEIQEGGVVGFSSSADNISAASGGTTAFAGAMPTISGPTPLDEKGKADLEIGTGRVFGRYEEAVATTSIRGGRGGVEESVVGGTTGEVTPVSYEVGFIMLLQRNKTWFPSL